MAEVKIQKIPLQDKGFSKRELYATVCYFYPQYSLKEVEALSGRDVALLIKTAQRQEALKYYNFTLIAQAPHSKKQTNVKKLAEHFKKLVGK